MRTLLLILRLLLAGAAAAALTGVVLLVMLNPTEIRGEWGLVFLAFAAAAGAVAGAVLWPIA